MRVIGGGYGFFRRRIGRCGKKSDGNDGKPRFRIDTGDVSPRGKRLSKDEIADQSQNTQKEKSVDKTRAKKEKVSSPMLKIGIIQNGKTIIKTLAVEDYLKGVIPGEMSPDCNEEALKAQAVAARTYALARRGTHKKDGFDICSSNHCQLYVENSADPRTDRAVNSTKGEVIVYNGEPIMAVFHTDSGGMTEGSEFVWGTMHPYLRPTKDKNIGTMPWTKKISLDELAKAAALDEVKGIKLSPLAIGKGQGDRSLSGSVLKMKIIGKKNKKDVESEIGGVDLRRVFGLKSTLFDVKIVGKEAIFSGFGFGHGVGMSQRGADEMAKTASYVDILRHYYNGVTIKKLY